MKSQIPKEVTHVTSTLTKAGFEAFLVGGCVRDLLLHRQPKDWDVTTNATPEEIIALFPKTVYENAFGTVMVIDENVSDETLRTIEVTPYRIEGKYSDQRHPDKVSFTRNIEDDLKRRDFTINAMALGSRPGKMVHELAGEFIDLFDGQKDLKNKGVRTVGDPNDRFQEDALRLLRAVRFATELGFKIEKETSESIKKNSKLLGHIAKERIRDEFSKIIMTEKPSRGIEMLKDFDLLKFIAPELEDGLKIEQNKNHIYHVWEHNLNALDHAASQKWPLEIRLSALFHDIGKPASRRLSEDKKDYTFYGHEVISARISTKIMASLRYPKDTVDLVTKLVRYHMFFSDTEKISLSAVRRIVRNVGPEHIWDLMKVRFCDRVGMGRPKETPYRLRKYESMIEEAMRAPLSVSMLKLDGIGLMKLLDLQPGPKVGFILNALFEEVLEDPDKNTEKWLKTRSKELNKLSDKELETISKKAKETKNEAEESELKQIRDKWYVK
jgi:poly(A) polymerase/tRNA nucleotidyltransferase (CCA-adding enzyme)